MANLGLAGVAIGLDCTTCGKPLRVDYTAHGSSPAFLIGDVMQELVKAAARTAIEQHGMEPLCKDCAPPPTETPFQGRIRELRAKA